MTHDYCERTSWIERTEGYFEKYFINYYFIRFPFTYISTCFVSLIWCKMLIVSMEMKHGSVVSPNWIFPLGCFSVDCAFQRFKSPPHNRQGSDFSSLYTLLTNSKLLLCGIAERILPVDLIFPVLKLEDSLVSKQIPFRMTALR